MCHLYLWFLRGGFQRGKNPRFDPTLGQRRHFSCQIVCADNEPQKGRAGGDLWTDLELAWVFPASITNGDDESLCSGGVSWCGWIETVVQWVEVYFDWFIKGYCERNAEGRRGTSGHGACHTVPSAVANVGQPPGRLMSSMGKGFCAKYP